MRNNSINALLFAALSLCMLFCSSSQAAEHPEKVSGLPNCSECHSDSPLAALNHKAADFFARHKHFAAAGRQTCASCHQESFCSDCHGRKVQLKPSDRFADNPLRTLPHRGDYLSQHKIEGRINPAACAKCHGRQNNARCVSCHK